MPQPRRRVRTGIGLVILSVGGERLDTRNPTSKLMITILAGVATWERELMLERQREGIAKAKAARRLGIARSINYGGGHDALPQFARGTTTNFQDDCGLIATESWLAFGRKADAAEDGESYSNQ